MISSFRAGVIVKPHCRCNSCILNKCMFNNMTVPSAEYMMRNSRLDEAQAGIKIKWSEVKSLSHVQLCDPMDCSLPGSSVHGIFLARILEWVVISFSRGTSQPRDRTQVSRIVGRCFTAWATREAYREDPQTLHSNPPSYARHEYPTPISKGFSGLIAFKAISNFRSCFKVLPP